MGEINFYLIYGAKPKTNQYNDEGKKKKKKAGPECKLPKV